MMPGEALGWIKGVGSSPAFSVKDCGRPAREPGIVQKDVAYDPLRSEAKSLAAARSHTSPIPDGAPVTTAVFPVILFIGSLVWAPGVPKRIRGQPAPEGVTDQGRGQQRGITINTPEGDHHQHS